jgi:hypothetical protein
MDGFKFLGFKFKCYEGRGLLVTPSPESKKAFRGRVRTKLRERKYVSSSILIKELNPIIVEIITGSVQQLTPS